MHSAVVLLYGLTSPSRPDYNAYLDFISQEIDKNKYTKVILCGGYTDPKRPAESEASCAKAYITKKSLMQPIFILEDTSINTNQNIEYAARCLTPHDTCTLYCDLIRLPKVIWIALHYFKKVDLKTIYKLVLEHAKSHDIYKPFSYDNITIQGFDIPSRTKEDTIAQIYTSLLDVVSLYDSELYALDILWRKEQCGLSK